MIDPAEPALAAVARANAARFEPGLAEALRLTKLIASTHERPPVVAPTHHYTYDGVEHIAIPVEAYDKLVAEHATLAEVTAQRDNARQSDAQARANANIRRVEWERQVASLKRSVVNTTNELILAREDRDAARRGAKLADNNMKAVRDQRDELKRAYEDLEKVNDLTLRDLCDERRVTEKLKADASGQSKKIADLELQLKEADITRTRIQVASGNAQRRVRELEASLKDNPTARAYRKANETLKGGMIRLQKENDLLRSGEDYARLASDLEYTKASVADHIRAERHLESRLGQVRVERDELKTRLTTAKAKLDDLTTIHPGGACDPYAFPGYPCQHAMQQARADYLKISTVRDERDRAQRKAEAAAKGADDAEAKLAKSQQDRANLADRHAEHIDRLNAHHLNEVAKLKAERPIAQRVTAGGTKPTFTLGKVSAYSLDAAQANRSALWPAIRYAKRDDDVFTMPTYRVEPRYIEIAESYLNTLQGAAGQRDTLAAEVESWKREHSEAALEALKLSNELLKSERKHRAATERIAQNKRDYDKATKALRDTRDQLEQARIDKRHLAKAEHLLKGVAKVTFHKRDPWDSSTPPLITVEHDGHSIKAVIREETLTGFGYQLHACSNVKLETR